MAKTALRSAAPPMTSANWLYSCPVMPGSVAAGGIEGYDLKEGGGMFGDRDPLLLLSRIHI